MADLKRLAEDATTKAAIAAGKDAAKRALDDFILSDDEKAKRDTATVEVKKSRRWKYIGLGVLALCLLAGVLGLLMAVMSYWPYFLMAGVLGAAGVYGWWRFRKSRGAPKDPIDSAEAPAIQAKVKADPVRVVEGLEVDVAAQRAAAAREARERAEAQREARAEAERQIDDELAQMKAKLKK
jgi:hypothetical protein